MWNLQRIVRKCSFPKGRFHIGRRFVCGQFPGMNPLEHRILEALRAIPDGHSTAFNVFNVLNIDSYNVTKHEFEKACEKLHDCTCISYRPIRNSLIDIPIGTLDLRTTSPGVDPSSPEVKLAPSIESLREASAPESLAIEEIRCPVESETQSNGATCIGKPLRLGRRFTLSAFAVPMLLVQAWQRARPSSWFPGFAFRF
jgi:hypothetical protein